MPPARSRVVDDTVGDADRARQAVVELDVEPPLRLPRLDRAGLEALAVRMGQPAFRGRIGEDVLYAGFAGVTPISSTPNVLVVSPAKGWKSVADLVGAGKLKSTDGVSRVSEPLVNSPGTAAILTVTPTTAPSDRATEDLRSKTLSISACRTST